MKQELETRKFFGKFLLKQGNLSRKQILFRNDSDPQRSIILAFVGVQYIDIPLEMTNPEISIAGKELWSQVYDRITYNFDFIDAELYLIKCSEGNFNILAGAFNVREK
jgi:hypothetical protein